MRRTRKYRKRGGRIIGEGMQGIAFSPPLACNDACNVKNPSVILNNGKASPITKKAKQYVTKIEERNDELLTVKVATGKTIQSLTLTRFYS